MFRIPEFDIKVDFEKSHDSYLFDQNRGEYFLDFFSFWSSLPLGYNHPIFKEKGFTDTIRKISVLKMANNAMETDEWNQFVEGFCNYPGMNIFSHFHFCCTGALAVESAIKTAIDYRRAIGFCQKPIALSFKGNFHGVSCWGLATDRFPPHNFRLEGYPQVDWPKLTDADEVEEFIGKNGPEDIAAILVEPVQCTFGDRYFPRDFFTHLRQICDENNIPLVFDEIQTGFGVTGKMWYYQHLGIEPDIVAFGKKSQVSGMMAKEKFGAIISNPVRKLELTWDGDLIDMVRCHYILEAYDRYNILANVNERGDQLVAWLLTLGSPELSDAGLQNYRRQGLLAAFDLPSPELKKMFAQLCFQNRLLVSPASFNCIRLRPNLNVSAEEIHEATDRIKRSLENLQGGGKQQ